MSAHLMGQVWKRYPAGGGELLLALAIADHAHDDGTHVYPSIAALAEKTRQSERTVQRQLRRMEESGWLELVNSGKGGRPKKGDKYSATRRYRVSPAWIKGDKLTPLNDEQKGDIAMSPLPANKGDNLTPIPDAKGCHPEQKRVTHLCHPNRHRTVSKREETPPLPAGLSADTWADFLAHRKKLRSPMTAEAEKRALAKLARLAAEGHDPEKIVDLAIVQGWKGLFERDETLKQPPRLGDHHENRSGIGRQRLSGVDRVIAANQERLERLGEL